MSVYSAADASKDLVTKIVTLWGTSEFDDINLYGNNGPKANLDEEKKFVNYEIEFRDSEQVTLGSNPIDRTWGSVEFHFGVRAGTGTRAALVMQAFLKDELKATTIGKVKTLIPSVGPTKVAPGWIFETLYVPFYFDGLPIANKHE